MIELYIENHKVDLTDDIEINFTYETIDPDKLSSIKNSFSKTVNIPGTPNNNKLFGYIFRYDKNLYYINNGNIGNNYDPHKRVNWFINKNGSLVNRGYCTLDNIKVKNDYEITYQFTLYGGIGEFFYSLSYNEDGSEKTLYDLFWNWVPKLGIDEYSDATTIETENSVTLYNCEPGVVAESYSKLNPYYTTTGATQIDKDVVFVPCYTGYYNDFDSKHMLVCTALARDIDKVLTNQTRNNLSDAFPYIKVEEDDVYTALNRSMEYEGLENYGLVKFSRDIDPFEAGEMRLNDLPVAIRLSKLMEVISNPVNNGGYAVEWDETIKSSPYWLYSWIMLDKLKSDKANPQSIPFTRQLNYDSSITFYPEVNPVEEYSYPNESVYTGFVEEGIYKIVTNYTPSVSFVAPSGYYGSTNYDKFVSYVQLTEDSGINMKVAEVWNTLVLLTVINSDSELLTVAADIFCYTNDYVFKNNMKEYSLEEDYEVLKPKLQAYLDEVDTRYTHIIDTVNVHKIQQKSVDCTLESSFERITATYNTQKLTYDLVIPRRQTIAIRQYAVVCYNYLRTTWISGNVETHAGIYGYGEHCTLDNNYYKQIFSRPRVQQETLMDYPYYPWAYVGPHWINQFGFSLDLDLGKNNGLYVTSSSGFTPIQLTKETLFASSQSPMKYLSGFCKLMNYRFIADETQKKIYIKDLKNYYINNVYDLTDRVDFGREINIKNVTANFKHLSIGLETPETYPVTLFNKISKDKFNTKQYSTNIEYPAPDSELLNDLIFQNTIDWQQSSIFYNIYEQMPKAYNTPTISWNLFRKTVNEEGETKLETKEFITSGAYASEASLVAHNDPFPKNALFDKDNKSVDIEASLLFLNGFVKNYDYVKVPQDTQEDYIRVSPDQLNLGHSVDINGNIVYDITQGIAMYFYTENTSYLVSSSGFSDPKYATDNTYVINYYDSRGNWLGGQYTKLQLHQYETEQRFTLNIPDNTYMIYYVSPSPDSLWLYTRGVPYTYVVSPRLFITQDNAEQFYLNQSRCYQYDFSYSLKDWYNWGYASKTSGLSASSFVLPMFTKDLYNTYGTRSTYIITDPQSIISNVYIDNTGAQVSDNNFEVFEYTIIQSYRYRLSAYYSFDWSGIAVAYYDTNDQFLGTQFIVTPPQTRFTDVNLTIPSNAKKMLVNVQKSLSEYTFVKYSTNQLGWQQSQVKVASWNFVNQNSLDNQYDITNTTFVMDPTYYYTEKKDTLIYVNNNEYKINGFPQDNDKTRIYDTKWKNYLDDLYDRNARDVTAYVDLSGFGNANNIMRNIYSWKSHLWVITKLENFKVAETVHDRFTKVTMHKIQDISNWTN